MEEKSGERRQRDVGGRPGGGDKNHVAARLLQRSKVDGTGLAYPKRNGERRSKRTAGIRNEPPSSMRLRLTPLLMSGLRWICRHFGRCEVCEQANALSDEALMNAR
jgi:hypothetical protein